MAHLERESWFEEDLLVAPLASLRKHEWLWRDPNEPLPSSQRIRRMLDPLLFRRLSKSHLQKGISEGPYEDIRFAWASSAIEINPYYSEAYVRRALDGDIIFRNRGQTQRLQGRDVDGSECYYDTDYAIVDTLIALAIEPQWTWAMRASGMLLLWKARDLKSDQWLSHATERLRKAAGLAEQSNNTEVLQHCHKLLHDIEKRKLNQA